MHLSCKIAIPSNATAVTCFIHREDNIFSPPRQFDITAMTSAFALATQTFQITD